MARTFGQNQPVLLDKPAGEAAGGRRAAAPSAGQPGPGGEIRNPSIRIRATRFGTISLTVGALASVFWLVGLAAFVWGWMGPAGLAAIGPAPAALLAAGAFVPPLLFMAIAATLARSAAMHEATRALLAATDRLFAADDTAANNAARLSRFIRRELDGLNTGLDSAAQRMRALEQVLENQIASLDEAGARAEVRGQTIAARLGQESQRMETLGDGLTDAASRASETVAGRAAQLKAMMESAEGTLKMATQSLDVQAAGFRAAVTSAAEAPHEAAVELDRQAARIEEVAGAAASRAEFVLARQEKQRGQLSELMTRLEQEGERLDNALSEQRRGLEQAVEALATEARKCEIVTEDAERHLEMLMVDATTRAEQLTGAFAREAERLKESADAAAGTLAGLSAALKEAGTGAQTLIGESAAQAKHDARLLVGEAMAECERLLRTAGEMSAEASKIRGLLSKTTEDVERHIIRLPGLAQEEARRMRQLVASETEQLLDLSARAMSTLHARAGHKPQQILAAPANGDGSVKPEPESEGLKGLARMLTTRGKRERGDAGKAWEMKTLLAAAEQGDDLKLKASGQAASLSALEAGLTDLAINLSALEEEPPGNDEWKRYLAGDRGVFARRLASAIDDEAVDRITALYREDRRFHDAADAYISEFEMLLDRAKDGDGAGLLTSTLLSADTGKVYLAIAYALGRL
ncbi:MAG: hypothetical protein H6924_12150 [Alphaproteobacteria bacterium]|nr:hypothetical protein [Alphaproteobacteria bacterium]